MRIYALLLLSSLSWAEDKPLAQLNSLTQTLTAKETVATEEVERLFEQAEVIAFRDATRGVTPQSINYAASCEKAANAYALKGAGPARVLVELSLVLAGLNGGQADRFRAILIASLGLKSSDAKPMPELPAQLDEIAEWAARTIENLAPRLPAEEAALANIRLQIARGKFADAAEKAQKLGARGQAWRAAALILKGDKAPAGNFDGEGALIVRAARSRRDRLKLAAQISPEGNALARCRQIFDKPAGTGDHALACAILLWDEPDRTWLTKAAAMAPSGNAGAPLRAAEALRTLFSGKHSEEILLQYRRELALMNPTQESEKGERRALWLLGNIAAASQPSEWAPASPEEQKEMLALDRGAPCDASTFALRALAVRGNQPVMAAFASSVVERCVKDGAPVAVDALGMLLAMAHDPAHAVKNELVEKLSLQLAQAHPTDPESIGAHADAVASRALAEGGAEKAPLFALEAALARYEEAIRKSTPTSGASARGRLEANAGFLSTVIASRLEGKKRIPFLMRAQRHLRFALALDDHPAPLATRAEFDRLSGMRMGQPPSLDKLPPSPARTRAACLLAGQAGVGTKIGEHYLSLARKGEANPLDTTELMIAPQASFNVRLDERGLHPATVMRSDLYLAPPCDPDHIKTPPREAARSTPAPRTEVER